MHNPGRAKVLSPSEQEHLFETIAKHRHPEKNLAIMLLSFKLGLRPTEIALLKVKDAVTLGNGNREFSLNENLLLDNARIEAHKKSKKSKLKRQNLSFAPDDFHEIVKQIEDRVRLGEKIRPEDFYPAKAANSETERHIKLDNAQLVRALQDYLKLRLDKGENITPDCPLFISQKGGTYSPNTLQEHMALMLRDWAGIANASAHSGRNTYEYYKRQLPVRVQSERTTGISWQEKPTFAIEKERLAFVEEAEVCD